MSDAADIVPAEFDDSIEPGGLEASVGDQHGPDVAQDVLEGAKKCVQAGRSLNLVLAVDLLVNRNAASVHRERRAQHADAWPNLCDVDQHDDALTAPYQ